MSKLELVDKSFEKFFSKTTISIAIICIISLGIRFYFTNFEIPLESQDAFHFLIQAIDIQREGIANSIPPYYGWQAFLSFFVFLDPFDELIEYMNLTRVLAIIFSVATIPIVFKIGRKNSRQKICYFGGCIFWF